METTPNLLNIMTAFQRKDSWAEKTLQEESLAVGVQMDQRKRRVSDREARRLDLQAWLQNYDTMPLKSFVFKLVDVMKAD